MYAAFRLFLIVMLALTSQGLASARGQPRAVSELVICAGATVITLSVDEQGRPVKHSDFCPDMAPHLLAAVSIDAPMPARQGAVVRAASAMQPGRARGRDAPVAQARDPPRHLV
ncbi:hypothetical protein [Paracoccus xiamenensis]|uniref:hypothetical protein n=1 Tax=Paracoccus xiamenensis TaxID=2714901 RepID=UPI00140B53DE|nr:hypothetical protein [Paracoccus xiamenensis]NHF73707.1 hypothetical protein [Paracoccus xiamenensis]